jgi:hypothetical protein
MLSRTSVVRVAKQVLRFGRTRAQQRKYSRFIPITICYIMGWCVALWPVEQVINETLAVPGPLKRLSFEFRRTLYSPE